MGRGEIRCCDNLTVKRVVHHHTIRFELGVQGEPPHAEEEGGPDLKLRAVIEED